ncbi:MAG TPA: tetratricopeptide repeat protein, partial [Chloroflexota bacterium]|nr:tetratricopeptide repeat protein [Chloroflexota bacterium]
AHLAVEAGDYAGARAVYEESLATTRELGFNYEIVQAITGLANLASVEGDHVAAARLYDEVAELHQDLGEEVRWLQFRGIAANHRGEHAEARTLLLQALGMFADGGFPWGVFEILGELGQTFVGMGQVRRGTVLLGAVEALISGQGRFCRCCTIPFTLAGEKTRAATRAQLGDAEFEKTWQEGRALSLEQAVEFARAEGPQLSEPTPSKESRAKALNTAANLARMQGDVTECRVNAEEALQLAREIGDRLGEVDALNNLAGIETNLERARNLYEECLAIRKELGDRSAIAGATMNLGVIAMSLGDYETARTRYEESLATARDVGNKALVAWIIFNLAGLATEQGDVGQARIFLEESLSMCEELGDRDSVCNARIMLANLAAEEGDYTTARSLYEESLATARALGVKGYVAGILQGTGAVEVLQGETQAAIEHYEEVTALLREIDDEPGALIFPGMAAGLRGEHKKALALHEEALALSATLGNPRFRIEALALVGSDFVNMGQARRGAVLLGAADSLISALGTKLCFPVRIPCGRAQATARAQRGDSEFEKAWQEGRAMSMEEAIEFARSEAAPPTGPAPSTESRIKALNTASALARSQGDLPAARSLAEEALKLAKETDEREGEADALAILGGIASDLWYIKEACALYEESLAKWKELGDKAGIARTLMALGWATAKGGDRRRARSLYEESLAMWRELGDRAMVAWDIFNLGGVASEEGDFDRASALYEESRKLCEEIGDRESGCQLVACLGNDALEEGDFDRASDLFERSLATARELDVKQDIVLALMGLGNLASMRGNSPSASAFFDKVAALEKEMGDQVFSVFFSGVAANHRGEYTTARTLLEEVLATFEKRGHRKGMAETLGEVAEALVGMGQTRRGVMLLGSTQHTSEELGVLCRACSISFERAHERLRAIARAQLGDGDFEKAWQQGRAMSMEKAVEFARAEFVLP